MAIHGKNQRWCKSCARSATSAISDSLWPHGLQPARLLCPCILQARILEWVAISSSRGSFRPRDRTGISCIAGGFFTTEPPGKPDGSQGIYINPWTFQFWLCSLTRVLCLSWCTWWRHCDIIITSFRTGQQSWMHPRWKFFLYAQIRSFCLWYLQKKNKQCCLWLFYYTSSPFLSKWKRTHGELAWEDLRYFPDVLSYNAYMRERLNAEDCLSSENILHTMSRLLTETEYPKTIIILFFHTFNNK